MLLSKFINVSKWDRKSQQTKQSATNKGISRMYIRLVGMVI